VKFAEVLNNVRKLLGSPKFIENEM